jgi:hypothetical protein
MENKMTASLNHDPHYTIGRITTALEFGETSDIRQILMEYYEANIEQASEPNKEYWRLALKHLKASENA